MMEESTPPMTDEQQAAYLYLLAKGASPAAACEKLGLSLVTVAEHIERHERFRSLLARVNALLSQNVAAALYRSAMEGKVSAQTFYVKYWPPPSWPEHEDDPHLPSLNEITDDELIAQFRKEAPALLAQCEAADESVASSRGRSARSSRRVSKPARPSRR